MGALQPIIDDARAQYRENKVIFALLILYCLIFAGFFFMPTDIHRDVLYISLPFSLYAAFKNRDFLKDFFKAHKGSILIAAFYILYISLSLFWSNTTEDGREFDKGKILLFLPLAMVGLFITVKKTPLAYSWLVFSFVIGAFFSGFYLLVAHAVQNFESDYVPRLEGLGRAENSVMAGYLYAMALLAIAYAKPFVQMAWKYRAIIGIVAIMIMLCSLSRGPLLALCVSVGVMALLKKQYKLIAAGTLGAIVAAVLIFGSGMRQEIPIINRGDTGRPQVWAQSIAHIAEKPIFGHGIGSKFTYDYIVPSNRVEKASHPHSVYLGTVIQGGIVSLLLLVGVMIVVGRGAFRIHRQTGEGWPLAVFVSFATLGLYDFGGVYVNLGVVWVAFWFQYALIMAREKPDPVV